MVALEEAQAAETRERAALADAERRLQELRGRDEALSKVRLSIGVCPHILSYPATHPLAQPVAQPTSRSDVSTERTPCHSFPAQFITPCPRQTAAHIRKTVGAISEAQAEVDRYKGVKREVKDLQAKAAANEAAKWALTSQVESLKRTTATMAERLQRLQQQGTLKARAAARKIAHYVRCAVEITTWSGSSVPSLLHRCATKLVCLCPPPPPRICHHHVHPMHLLSSFRASWIFEITLNGPKNGPSRRGSRRLRRSRPFRRRKPPSRSATQPRARASTRTTRPRAACRRGALGGKRGHRRGRAAHRPRRRDCRVGVAFE